VIRHPDFDFAVNLLHLREVVQMVADEDHALLPGFLVEEFPFSMGPQIPIDDIDIHVRVYLYEF
jgi:hypothetical protein